MMTETMALGVLRRADAASAFLRGKLPAGLQQPQIAIVCGSGLVSTVEGHEGKMLYGTMGPEELPVVLLVGRAHYYEGHSMDQVTFATRVCQRLGVHTMIVTNAAGGLNADYKVGDIVVLHDHLNLAGLVGVHPLRGPNEADFGVRFPALSDAYDLELRRKAHLAWKSLTASTRLREGVYAFVGGPSYETRAECRMLRMLGGDLVGMSTVPEVIVARHSGIRVLALSLVTNVALTAPTPPGDDPQLADLTPDELRAFLSRGRANHLEVLDAGRTAEETMQSLVKAIVHDLR